MHEFSTAMGIIETITEVAKQNNAIKIKRVEIVIGDFTMLHLEQLKFSFDIASQGTLAEGAKLAIERNPGEIQCSQCNYQGPIKKQKKDVDHYLVDLSNIFECPKCHSNLTKISGGRDIFVKNIEIELE